MVSAGSSCPSPAALGRSIRATPALLHLILPEELPLVVFHCGARSLLYHMTNLDRIPDFFFTDFQLSGPSKMKFQTWLAMSPY